MLCHDSERNFGHMKGSREPTALDGTLLTRNY